MLKIVSFAAAAFFILTAAAPAKTITCDKEGCRAGNQAHSLGRVASHGRKAARNASGAHRGIKTHPRASVGHSVGIVRSKKTGRTAKVAARYRDRFQNYIDDLEAHGATIWYMGGFRHGRCSEAHQHPCGAALDVCQDWRGHVSWHRDCHLPHPNEMAAIAARHGLFEGGLWCQGDYGHAQVLKSRACPHRHYAVGSWGHGHGSRTYSAHSHRRELFHNIVAVSGDVSPATW